MKWTTWWIFKTFTTKVEYTLLKCHETRRSKKSPPTKDRPTLVIYMIRQLSIEAVMLCADSINTLFINFDINILTDFLRKKQSVNKLFM